MVRMNICHPKPPARGLSKMEPDVEGIYVFWWEAKRVIDSLKDLARRQDEEIQKLKKQLENLPYGQ